MRAGTTIVLAVPCENMFFTEHVIRHFQRRTDDDVNLLLVTNDQTSDEVADLVDFLAQHERTSVHQAFGCRDLPIGASVDHALARFGGLRERLLFTHMDLFYLEPRFWDCDALAGDVRLASGPFVQPPLWHLDEPEPIPRPADDHILVDTRFYLDTGLVFRAFARAALAFEIAPWLPGALAEFRTAEGQRIDGGYPLDPFNLSHLLLSHLHGKEYRRMWTYHYPRQCHVASVLRIFQAGVKRVEVDGSRRLWVPLSARTDNGGYHWRTIVRYAVISSLFFNPLSDYVIPIAAVEAADAEETRNVRRQLAPAIEFLRALTGPVPYRAVGEDAVRGFELRWWDDGASQ